MFTDVRKSFIASSARISLEFRNILSSDGMPLPLAMRSFLVKVAAMAAAADTAAGPSASARARRARSSAARSGPMTASAKARISLPPGTPLSRAGSSSAARSMVRPVSRPLSRRNQAWPAVQ